MGNTQFEIRWSDSYHVCLEAGKRLKKKGFRYWIGAGEFYSDILTASELGAAIATLIFSGVRPDYFICNMREKGEKQWKRI